MAGWFDRERDRTAEPHAPIESIDYDDLSNRALERLYALKQARVLRLLIAVTALGAGALTAALPLGWALVIPATALFVGGLFATPIAAYLLRSVVREIRGRELEMSFDREGRRTS